MAGLRDSYTHLHLPKLPGQLAVAPASATANSGGPLHIGHGTMLTSGEVPSSGNLVLIAACLKHSRKDHPDSFWKGENGVWLMLRQEDDGAKQYPPCSRSWASSHQQTCGQCTLLGT